MTNTQTQITTTYQTEDLQQILHLAIAKREEGGELTKAQVMEIATEMGITPEELEVAEKEWLLRKEEFQEKQVFDSIRKQKLKQSLIKYGIVNTFLVLLNLATAHTLSWSLPILLLWGAWLALKAWITYQNDGEEYEKEFQRWRLKKQVGKSIGSLADRVFKSLQA
jgi:hypothetical protein